MATITANKDKSGKIRSYKITVCVGRDDRNRQIWRTCTLPRPEGLTPAKERKEIQLQAETWAKAQREEFKENKTKASRNVKPRMTFAAFVKDVWMKDHVENPKRHTPSTVSFYEYMAKDLVDYFGQVKISAIDGETVKRYVAYCENEAQTKRGDPYSATTVRHHYRTLWNILHYAQRFKYIKSNPCDELEQDETPKAGKKQIDFLEPEEAKRFLKCLEGETLFWRTYGTLLIVTGLRRGEATGLQWGDIDRDALIIKVQRNVTIDRDAPEKYRVGPTKTKDSRTVPITRSLLALLLRRKAEQEAEHGTVLPTAFVFSRSTDPYKPIYPTEPTRWQRKFTTRNGLPKVSPHDLRHTAATLALEAGANLKEVQVLLGHADPATTMKFYAGVTEAAQRRTVEGVEELLTGSNSAN